MAAQHQHGMMNAGSPTRREVRFQITHRYNWLIFTNCFRPIAVDLISLLQGKPHVVTNAFVIDVFVLAALILAACSEDSTREDTTQLPTAAATDGIADDSAETTPDAATDATQPRDRRK